MKFHLFKISRRPIKVIVIDDVDIPRDLTRFSHTQLCYREVVSVFGCLGAWERRVWSGSWGTWIRSWGCEGLGTRGVYVCTNTALVLLREVYIYIINAYKTDILRLI